MWGRKDVDSLLWTTFENEEENKQDSKEKKKEQVFLLI